MGTRQSPILTARQFSKIGASWYAVDGGVFGPRWEGGRVLTTGGRGNC